MFSDQFANRLTSTLAAVEHRDNTDDGDIETLSELASIAVENASHEGYLGGTGPLSVRTLNTLPDLDPTNDGLVISHIRQIITKSAKLRGVPLRAGMPIPSANIPYEDRGKTARTVSGGPAQMGEFVGDFGSDRPEQLTTAQWVVIAKWSLAAIGKIIQKRRERKNA